MATRPDPRGVPSVSYVRIASQAGDNATDIITDGNAITILDPGQPSTRHDVAQVLQRGMNDEEVCVSTIGNQAGAGIGASLNPVSAFVVDAATVVIILVGSRRTKKWQFLKKFFLPFLAQETFALLMEKEQTQDYNYQVTLSSFEIQDEVITDLLRPSSRGLAVSVTAEEGVVVPGLHRENIKDVTSLERQLLEACENRASHTQPLGASIDTSAAIWELSLGQSEGAGGDMVHRSFSKLVVLDLPSVDSLVGINSDIRQLESLTLHKSLMAFVDVVRRLSSPSKAALAPFRASKLTHYLSEMLGGNAIVVGLGLIAGGEAACSRKTLDVMGALTSAVHYPVGGKELTDVLQGLLGKYRAMILQLQDEIMNGAPIGEKAPELSEKRMNDLQRDLADAQMERNTAREDRARIFEMMELLKAKYGTLVTEKAAQAQELIKAEEDKLSVARALVELKLEYSARQEQSEKEKFELTSELLNVKNAIFDLDAQLLLARGEVATLKDANSELESRVQHDHEELAGTRASLQEVRDQLSREVDKNLEVGAELLTLINQKDVLQRRVDDLQQKTDTANVKLAAVTTQEIEARRREEEAHSALKAREEENISLKRAVADAELDAKRVMLELEHLQQDLDRKEEDWSRERTANEAALLSLKDGRGGALEGRRPMIGGDENQMQLKYEHKLRDEARQLKRTRDDLEMLQQEKDLLGEECSRLRESYRQKLASQIAQTGRPNSVAATAEETDNVLDELVGTFKAREETLNASTDEALKNVAALRHGLRILFDKYQAALDAMEENLPQALFPEDPILDEEILSGEDALREASTLLEDATQFERVASRGRVDAAEQKAVEEQKRMNLTLSKYKDILHDTEAKLAEARRVQADQAIQIQQLVAAGPSLPPAAAPPGSEGVLAEQQAIMRAMNEQLARQMQQLQEVKSGGAADVRKEPEPLQMMSMPVASAPLKAVPEVEMPAPSQLKGATPTTLEEAIARIRELESGANAAVLHRLRETETENMKCVSRVRELEEELSTYREYMKTTIIKYKKDLQKYSSAVAKLPVGKEEKTPTLPQIKS